MPAAPQPRSAQHQDVEVAVVVVVGVVQVERAGDALEARGRAVLDVRSAARAAEQDQVVVAQAPARGDDVEHAVAVEVVDQRAAGHVEGVETELAGDVGEARELALGVEEAARQALALGDAVRIGADRHVGDVQEPAGADVHRIALEQGLEQGDRAGASPPDRRARRRGRSAGCSSRWCAARRSSAPPRGAARRWRCRNRPCRSRPRRACRPARAPARGPPRSARRRPGSLPGAARGSRRRPAA